MRGRVRSLFEKKGREFAEVDLLISDPTKARTTLGWELNVGFKELVTMMVDADMKRLGK